MNTRLKLIIFFFTVAVIIFILGILWMRQGGGKIEASEEKLKLITKDQLILVLDDYLETVNPKGTSIYTLEVVNHSKKDLDNLRIFGYVGLPTQGDVNPLVKIIPNWLQSQSFKDYPKEHYFNYVVSLAAGSKATARIPIKIKKFFEDQEVVYAKAACQILTPERSFWNIFSLSSVEAGPIIAAVEDTTLLE